MNGKPITERIPVRGQEWHLRHQSGISRKLGDKFAARFFATIAWISVFALLAMILFVFSQGSLPFFSPTSAYPMLATRGIQELQINGVSYQNLREFVDLVPENGLIKISFEDGGQERNIILEVDAEAEAEQLLKFPEHVQEYLSSPELYSYSLVFPAEGVLGTPKELHISLPEPRQGIAAFLGGLEWRPVHLKLYGIFPMIVASLLATLGAVIIGVPMALLASLFIAEFLPKRAGGLVRSAIDLLAGIPSVVYGFFGLMVLVPLVQKIFQSSSGSSLFAGSLILGIMILPTVLAISMTAFQAVPRSYREASLALGASPMQSAWTVVLPAARSGLLAAVVLGSARAIGETMAIILVAGNSPQIPTALSDSVRTLTATIALEMGYATGRHSQLLFSVGIVVFALILILNGLVMRFKRRLGED